ncbi:MAG: RDD family protein [Erysipelotrichaceae bacterium]|nr:RDD family protein [Erysipelotrichaceae bacterium]
MEEKKQSNHSQKMMMILNYVYDMIGILMPITLFIDSFILVFGNVISFTVLEIIMYWMFPVLLISLLGFNLFLIIRYGGTCGNLLLHLSLYQENQKPASITVKCRRELLEKAVPFVGLYLLFHTFGVLLYFFFCILFILVDRHHRSWVDVLLHTRLSGKVRIEQEERIVIQI